MTHCKCIVSRVVLGAQYSDVQCGYRHLKGTHWYCSSNMLLLTAALLLSNLLTNVNGISNIPNGDNIVNPCNQEPWPEVGNQDRLGNNPILNNRFGQDLTDNQNVWNAVLCKMDSDFDGRTNGEELGDPNCVWSVGQQPERTTGLSHPAVCEPISSSRCQGINSWLSCAKLPCASFDVDTTRNFDLLFSSKNTVPPNDVTYKCQVVHLPAELDYHLIGVTPILDKPYVVQQIILFGCDRTMPPASLLTTQPCSMGIEHCRTPIAIWDSGSAGQCHDEKYGFQMGINNPQYGVLQLHWKNPTHNTKLTEHSGLRIYYTPVKRPNTGQIVMVGQQDLDQMPARTASIPYSGSCTKECLQFLPKSIFIAEAVLHMHQQGSAGSIQLVRGGAVTTIVTEENYNYNIPKLVILDKVLELRAGDEIRVNCNFQTLNKNVSTHYGNAAADEMCYGFVTFYPAINKFDVCAQWRDVPICPLSEALTYSECDYIAFQTFFENITKNCNTSCSPACRSLAGQLRDTNCLNGNVGAWIEKTWPTISKYVALPGILNSTRACMPPTVPTTRNPRVTTRIPGGVSSTIPSSGTQKSNVFQAAVLHVMSTIFMILLSFTL